MEEVSVLGEIIEMLINPVLTTENINIDDKSANITFNTFKTLNCTG